jgi:ubiquinone/menaquinone biosynthesis C-methylase UbiE
MALYYRDKIKNKQKTKESFEEARKAYDLINETASVARIDKYISQ